MRRATLALLSALAVGAGALAPAASGGAAAAASHTVTLREFRFHPGNLTIRRGDSVTWVWRDQSEHNVTFQNMRSRTQVHGTYTVRFMRSGTFNYRCTIHLAEGMRGRIIVR